MSPVARIFDLLGPLGVAPDDATPALPGVEAVRPDEVPEPQRGLLVHDRDMTSTLEAWFGQTVVLRRLRSEERDGVLFRQVLLVGAQDGVVTEFGAIRIHLDRFREGSRERLREGHLPLGKILQLHRIEYLSAPTLYFRFRGDTLTDQAFGVRGSPELFGRHNVLRNPAGEPLAEAVEILPPLTPDDPQGRTTRTP